MRGAQDVRYLRPLVDELYSLVGGEFRTQINNIVTQINNLVASGFTSVATIAALGAVNTSKFVPGHLAYVQTPKSYWNYDPTSTATPNGVTVVAASGGGGNWLNANATGIEPTVSALAFPNVFARGKSITNASMLIGSANVTGPVGTWNQTNIGNLIVVPGALAGGQTFFANITSVSANGATAGTNGLSTAAVSGQTIAWGPDDAPGLQAAINALIGTSVTLVLPPSMLMLGSGLTIAAPGKITIRGSSSTTLVGAFGTGLVSTFSIIGANQNNLDPTNTTTLAAQANAGATTISVNTLGSHAPNLAVGGYFFMGIFSGPTHIFSSTYQIKNISGVGPFTITLDRPLQLTFPVATTTIWNMPGGRVEDVRIQGAGMKMTGSCQQFMEWGLAAHCLIEDVVMDTSIGNPVTGQTAAVLDAGSFDCEFRHCRLDGGVGGASPGGAPLTQINSGLAIQQGEQNRIADCVVENVINVGVSIAASTTSHFFRGTVGFASFGLVFSQATACSFVGTTVAASNGTGVDFGSSTGCYGFGVTIVGCQVGALFESNVGNCTDCSLIGARVVGSTTGANYSFSGGAGGTLSNCGLVDCSSTGAALSHGIDLNANSGPVVNCYLVRTDSTNNPGGSGVKLRAGVVGTVVDTMDVTGNGAFGMDIAADLIADKVISRGSNAGLEEIQVTAGRVTLHNVDIQVNQSNSFGIYTAGSSVVEVSGRVSVVAPAGGNDFNLYFDQSTVGSVHDFQAISSIGGVTNGISAGQLATRIRVGMTVDADGTTVPFTITGQSNRGTITAPGNVNPQTIPFTVVRSQERPQLHMKTAAGTPTPGGPNVAVSAGVGWTVTFAATDTSTYDYVGM